jgi:hypothetical protein
MQIVFSKEPDRLAIKNTMKGLILLNSLLNSGKK